jgi:hypothetical protein
VTEKEVDTDCNHDIRIHEDLGHVCRVCGVIVRKADTIIDYQWKKVCYLLKLCDAFITPSSFSNQQCFLYSFSFNMGKFLLSILFCNTDVRRVCDNKKKSILFCNDVDLESWETLSKDMC